MYGASSAVRGSQSPDFGDERRDVLPNRSDEVQVCCCGWSTFAGHIHVGLVADVADLYETVTAVMITPFDEGCPRSG